MPFWGIYDEQRRKETRIFSRIFSNARGVRYDRRGVARNTQYLTDKLVFIGVSRRRRNEGFHLNHCRDRRSTAVRSRSGSDNRTGLSFITLTPLRYLDCPKKTFFQILICRGVTIEPPSGGRGTAIAVEGACEIIKLIKILCLRTLPHPTSVARRASRPLCLLRRHFPILWGITLPEGAFKVALR